MARPAGFEPATPGLEGRSGEKTRNNTEQSGTESWFVCRVALLPHCVQDRVRDASGPGKRWIVPSPHAPRRRRRTPAPMPATGATRGPVRGVGGRGGGCRPRRRVRAPWAGGGPDGGRPETDAHRGIIGRSWPAKSPLRALLEAVTRPPPAAVDRRPIRRSARTRSIRPHRSSRLPVAPAHSASLSRPPERMWTDGRPPAATAKEGPLP